MLGIGEFVTNIDKIRCLTQNAYAMKCLIVHQKNVEEEFREMLCPTNVFPTDPSARSNNSANFDDGQKSLIKNNNTLTSFMFNTFLTVIVTFVTSSTCFEYFYCCCLKRTKF